MDKFVIRKKIKLQDDSDGDSTSSTSMLLGFSGTLEVNINLEVTHVRPSTLSLPIVSASIDSLSNNNNIILAGVYDFGNYIDYIHDINDFTKYMLLINHWVPGTTF